LTKEEFAEHFIRAAEHDFASMQRIFAAGEYVWAFDVAEQVIERLLKACCIKVVANEEPRTFNLLFLAERAGLETSDEQKDLLNRLVLFNIRARHPDFKGQFRAKATWRPRSWSRACESSSAGRLGRKAVWLACRKH